MNPPAVVVHGATHLGLTVAACLAHLGVRTHLTDHRDPQLIDALRRGVVPIVEPGLDELIVAGVERGMISFDHSDELTSDDIGVAWIGYDVPIDDQDRAAPEVVWSAVGEAAAMLRPGGYICVHSQVPVGSCRQMRETLPPERHVVYFMENLQVGRSIESFLDPDLIVLGTSDGGTSTPVHTILANMSTELITVPWETAELAKHALNLMLATSIVVGNEIGDIAERVGANGYAVVDIIRRDRRIGDRAPLRPGWGFSGGTLARDLRYLEAIGADRGVPTTMTETVHRLNRTRLDRLAALVAGATDRQHPAVSVLGASYKQGSDELRRSPAIDLSERLHAEGISAQIWDPVLSGKAAGRELGMVGLQASLDSASCVVLVQEGLGRRTDVLNVIRSAPGVRAIVDPWCELSAAADPRVIHLGVDQTVARG